MTNSKEIFLNKELISGDFYELSIQVFQSEYKSPIKIYTDFIWNLENVEGPYDSDFNQIRPDIANVEHKGILNFNNYKIPFMTFNINENEPIRTSINSFDICIDTIAIVKIFGIEYETWTENSKVPKQLEDFFNRTVQEFYKLYPFQLGILGWEVSSGGYTLDHLKIDLLADYNPSKFYVGKENYENILDTNKKFVTKIESL